MVLAPSGLPKTGVATVAAVQVGKKFAPENEHDSSLTCVAKTVLHLFPVPRMIRLARQVKRVDRT